MAVSALSSIHVVVQFVEKTAVQDSIHHPKKDQSLFIIIFLEKVFSRDTYQYIDMIHLTVSSARKIFHTTAAGEHLK